MHNKTDNRDDMVYKVKAHNEKHAKEVATEIGGSRFFVGWAASTKKTQFLKDYKWWSIDMTEKQKE